MRGKGVGLFIQQLSSCAGIDAISLCAGMDAIRTTRDFFDGLLWLKGPHPMFTFLPLIQFLVDGTKPLPTQ